MLALIRDGSFQLAASQNFMSKLRVERWCWNSFQRIRRLEVLAP